MTFTPAFNLILGILTIAAQIASLVLIIALILKQKNFLLRLQSYFLPVALATALVGTLGSLIYSNVIGYPPCSLCLLQRVLLYPQSILFLIAFFKKTKALLFVNFGLSMAGAIIAAYQYLLGLGLIPNSICSSLGAISCTKVYVMEFGYITIPFMSFGAFVFIAVITLSVIFLRPRANEVSGQ